MFSVTKGSEGSRWRLLERNANEPRLADVVDNPASGGKVLKLAELHTLGGPDHTSTLSLSGVGNPKRYVKNGALKTVSRCSFTKVL